MHSHKIKELINFTDDIMKQQDKIQYSQVDNESMTLQKSVGNLKQCEEMTIDTGIDLIIDRCSNKLSLKALAEFLSSQKNLNLDSLHILLTQLNHKIQLERHQQISSQIQYFTSFNNMTKPLNISHKESAFTLKIQNLDETAPGNETQDLYKSFSMPSPGLRPILINKSRLNSEDIIESKFEKQVKTRLILNSSAQFQKGKQLQIHKTCLDLNVSGSFQHQNNNSQVKPNVPKLQSDNKFLILDKSKYTNFTKKFKDFLKNQQTMDDQSTKSNSISPKKLNSQAKNMELQTLVIKKKMTKLLNFNPQILEK
ncbi:UNKNOWN [Stylonychia lemnae]|uniref:Uncharacterized protein n=1 Tax=Stylonychia lemnae TaxID=5949 RepID=A0A078AXV5_STYLE|nr:UNKNOWN [Stylonychia lemnae]|eukprot:CDW86886.1 UNKNOWN [Stylonychia lemnae]